MTADNLLDLRDRIPAQTTVPMNPADVVELARLRLMERNLLRPVAEVEAELARLQVIAYEARLAAEKVAEHEAKGYSHIRVGAFRRLRDELGVR